MMNRIRTWIYHHGYRPKYGTIFFSPSAAISYAWMDYVKARDPAMSMCLEGLFLNMPHAPHTFKDDNFVAQACDGILRSTMLENGGQMEIWVTSKNHQWAAHVTGLTLDEISKKYEDAEAQGLICTLLVPRERQSDVVRITEMYRDRRNPRG